MGEFERSLDKVLLEEGGWSDHPKDPGGATMKGVTQRVYDAYRARVGKPKQSVRYIGDSELQDIYRSSYWNLAKCDQLPAGVSYVVFDGAVNSGVKQSVKWLQGALGVIDDGVIGPTTINAARQDTDHDALIERICALRLAFLKSLKTFPTFGKGWTARVYRVRVVGQAWATGNTAPAPTRLVGENIGSAKASIEDVRTAPSTAVADAATGGGIGSGGLAATLQQVQDQLTPLSYSSQLIGKVVAGLVIASAVLTIGGLAYGFWARRRKAKLAEATQTVPT
jgi:lysozyme family protein